MKCPNCGKNDVTFYYESNVNGQVTRRQLCAECARELGFGTEELFGRSLFDDFFGSFFGSRRAAFPFGGLLPAMMQLRSAAPQTEQDGKCANAECCAAASAPQTETAGPEAAPAPEADGEMNRRRQINLLRAQMYEAVHAEEFEKAAQLRDRLRELEK